MRLRSERRMGLAARVVCADADSSSVAPAVLDVEAAAAAVPAAVPAAALVSGVCTKRSARCARGAGDDVADGLGGNTKPTRALYNACTNTRHTQTHTHTNTHTHKERVSISKNNNNNINNTREL